jgi:DNA-binding beta-propeller fold protein YncE
MLRVPPVLIAGAFLLAGVRAEAAERAYVLDRDAPSLTALAFPGGAASGTLALEGRPEAMARTPDGSTLLVLDRGPGKDKGEAGYQATGKAALTIVDAPALKTRARLELGYGLLSGETLAGILSPDGQRLAVVCPGYDSKSAAQILPRELVTVDIAKGVVAGRVPLAYPVTDISSDPDALRAFLFTPRRAGKEGGAARVTIVDLSGPRVTGEVELAGNPQPPLVSLDGRFLYLLDEGTPNNKKPERHVAGSLQVVSVASRALAATIEGGNAPRGLTVDPKSGQVFFVNDAPPTSGLQSTYGELHVVRGSAVATTIQTAPEVRFLRFSDSGDRLYAVAKQAIAVTALPGLQSHPLNLDRAKDVMLEDEPGPVSALGLSPDGKRAFVFHEATNRLLVLDLATEESVAMVNFGRGPLPKILKPLGLDALVAARTQSAAAAPSPFQDSGAVGPRVSAILVRPDSRFAYVLSPSGDVAVVDAAKGTLVDRIGGAGKEMRLLPGRRQLAVLGDDAVTLIETGTNKKGLDVPARGLRALLPTPDAAGVMAVTDTDVILLEAATGAERARAGGFRKVMRVLFAAAP